ncbi:ProQ/FINO family protein [Sphaerotilus mobilis]|uniref:ProQ/FINO family protein n=1 Tax=Sphaerotilus mobilis TaxID=47994 RepID=A0A4Q7LKX6_9BURK|nr:ProQ/FINO family protein [Sphaerotilus mobilis]RZS54871.1 ProQ/FINO family protein [Sphaerotilus mobilis]
MSIDPTQDPTQAAATDAPSADLPAAADVAAQPAAEPAALAAPAAPAEHAEPAEPAEPAPKVDAAADDAPVEAAAPAPDGEVAKPGLSPAECARELAQRFPALFDGPAKPLKLRIQADIQARAPGVFSRSVLSAFLRRLTGGTAYLNALSRAPARLDLDGQPAGEISEEHRQLALEELARRRALRNERRVAEGGGPPERGPRGPRPPAAEGVAPAEGAAPAADGSVAPARPPRGPRPVREGAPRDGAPRGERRDRPPRPEGARPDGARPDAPRREARGPRPEGQARGDVRPDGRPAGRPDGRGDRRPNDRPNDRPPQRHGDAPRPDRRPDTRPDTRAEQRPEVAEARIEDPERRQRARLLREWESTSLTRANFCVLRGVPEAQFDALLDQARAEARSHAPQAGAAPRGDRPAKPRG